MCVNNRLHFSASRVALLACCALLLGACAGARGPEAMRPRANEPVYPILLSASAERREQALAAWQALMQEQNLTPTPTPALQPVTAMISALPQGVTLSLPKVELSKGAAASKDEALRESLRRFFTTAAPLVGTTPKELSLVETREEGGTTIARYQQNPFQYPLRGPFGRIELCIAADGRVTSLTSTALPDTERLARALAAQPQKLTAKDAETRLAGRAVSYESANGAVSYTVGPNDPVKTRELVVYPLPRANDPNTLELHLAWDVGVERAGAPLAVYVDAVTGDIIAAEPRASEPAQTK